MAGNTRKDAETATQKDKRPIKTTKKDLEDDGSVDDSSTSGFRHHFKGNKVSELIQKRHKWHEDAIKEIIFGKLLDLRSIGQPKNPMIHFLYDCVDVRGEDGVWLRLHDREYELTSKDFGLALGIPYEGRMSPTYARSKPLMRC